jgi:hypothetical protein
MTLSGKGCGWEELVVANFKEAFLIFPRTDENHIKPNGVITTLLCRKAASCISFNAMYTAHEIVSLNKQILVIKDHKKSH